MSQIHPKPDDNFKPVTIKQPTEPSAAAAWLDAGMVATAVPRSDLPATLNGIPLEPWQPPFEPVAWEKLATRIDFPEPAFTAHEGKASASGVVTIEVDGRVWLVSPTNGYGGYAHTMPKGRLKGENLSMRANALKDAYEKTGLHIELTGFLCDIVRDTSATRYYLARRIGGTPGEMRWKSQAVHLVPAEQLNAFLTHANDQPVLAALQREGVKALSHRPTRQDLQRAPWLTSEKRILVAIEKYRSQYGRWPTRVRIDPGMAEAIRRDSLTPLGWALLTNRLEIVADAKGSVIAEGEARLEYDEELEVTQDATGVAEWIWGLPLWEK